MGLIRIIDGAKRCIGYAGGALALATALFSGTARAEDIETSEGTEYSVFLTKAFDF